MEQSWKVFDHGFHLHSRSIQEEKQPAKDDVWYMFFMILILSLLRITLKTPNIHPNNDNNNNNNNNNIQPKSFIDYKALKNLFSQGTIYIIPFD